MIIVKAGSTSVTVPLFIQDSASTTGAGKTGLAFNTSGWKAYYVKPGSAPVAITLVTQTATGAWTSGGFCEIDATNCPGWYRLDLPNAVVSTNAGAVVGVSLSGATGAAPVNLGINMVAFDTADTVRLGLTALPNVAQGSSGALPTGDASGRVTVGAYATGQDPATLVLATPANKLTTDSSGRVTVGAMAAAAVSNIWDALTSGITTVGSIGKLIKDNLDAAVSSRSTYAGGDTSGTTTLLNRIGSALTITGGKVDVNDKTGFSLSSAGVQAIWDALTSAFATVGSVGKRIADNLDAAVSSRSTYAGGDTSGVTTLLTRIPGVVQPQTGDAFARLGAPAGASVSADIAAAKGDTAAIKAKTDNLPADPASNTQVLTRLASASYTAPDNAGIATAAAQATSSATSASSADNKLTTPRLTLLDRLAGMIEAIPGGGGLYRYLAGALSQAPAGGGGGGSTSLVLLRGLTLQIDANEPGDTLRLMQGSDLSLLVTLLDSSGDPVPLTGFTITAQIRSATGSVVLSPTVTVQSAATGQVLLAIPASFTATAQRDLTLTVKLDGGTGNVHITYPTEVEVRAR